MQYELRLREQRVLDRQTRQFQAARGAVPPRGGWLRRVRKALGFTAADMAKDLKVSPSMVFQLERSEWNETITLRRLKDVAAAMECTVVYCVVPRRGKFEDQLIEYAKIVARSR
ncbi:MAG: helix-turn-helix domain-containing protein [Terracidiphilus sp.]